MRLTFLIILVAFIEFLYNLIINRFAESIYIVFKSKQVLIAIIIIIVILINLILIKRNVKFIKIILINLLTVTFLYLLIIFPFERGKQIFEIKKDGDLIVKGINSYYQSNKIFPNNLSDLHPQYCDSVNFRFNSDEFLYRKVTSPDSTKGEYYYLTYSTNFLESEYFKFDIQKGIFILTDD